MKNRFPAHWGRYEFGLFAFWKLLTLSGTTLVMYLMLTQPGIDTVGWIFLPVVFVGWLGMFLFTGPNV